MTVVHNIPYIIWSICNKISQYCSLTYHKGYVQEDSSIRVYGLPAEVCAKQKLVKMQFDGISTISNRLIFMIGCNVTE